MRNESTSKGPFPSRRAAGHLGFTLTEAAIVLCIVGVVLAGIFAAASAARKHVDLNRGLDEISLVTANMRSLYAGRDVAALGNQAASTAFEQTLVQEGVFPSEMVSGGLAYNPWSQSAASAAGTAVVAIVAASPSQFSLSYLFVPQDACISLLTSNSTQGPDTGLQQIQVNAVNVAALPVTASAAATACNNATSNTIAWYYTLGS